ncbi:copper-binding protein [Herbaspirillum sp. HC18]|nr:copper-binding protein [Herbaspirillum sp. HC18]
MKFTPPLCFALVLSASSLAIAQSDGMKGMEMGKPAQGKAAKTMHHQATAVVKAVDPAKDTVTLAHGPVKTLNWPAMTMDFKVNDKTLFDKLTMNKDVVVEFEKQGSNYVITSVK